MKKTFLLTICILLATLAGTAQTIRYVKQGGTGNGTSWANASGDLQAMINASSAGDQVWVAAGSYSRDNGDGNSFIMKEGVNVYGGFPATGTPTMANRTLPTAQTPANKTILTSSGGVLRRVLLQPADFTTPTVWDGFVIQRGISKTGGAGAYLRANGELRNCVVQDNTR